MTHAPLIDLLETGARFAWVYHVAGCDWAATDDPDFAAWINGSGATAIAYRKLLYGGAPVNGLADPILYSADYVQTVCALSRDLGAQTITASKEGGVDVGAWSATIAGEVSGYSFGRLFPYTAYSGQQRGLTGLNWLPSASTVGVRYGILSRDMIPDQSTGQGTLYWSMTKDLGLSDFITANSGDCFLWLGSSCVATLGSVATDGDDYSIGFSSMQFNTPLESLFYRRDFPIQITTAPTSFAGNTARLMAVPISVTESTITFS